MIIEVAILIAALTFVILSFFAVKTLISARRSLSNLSHLLIEMNLKMQSFDSSLNALSNVGDICEQETENLKERYLTPREERSTKSLCKTETSKELIEWIVLSINLGEKLLNRRK